MKNLIKTVGETVGRIALVLAIISVSMYTVMHLSGVWLIKLGELELNFSNGGYCMALIGLAHCVTPRNTLPEEMGMLERIWYTDLARSEARKYQVLFCLIGFLVTGYAYAGGQLYDLHAEFAYMGSLSLLDLLLAWIGIYFSVRHCFPIPKPYIYTEEEEAEEEPEQEEEAEDDFPERDPEPSDGLPRKAS